MRIWLQVLLFAALAFTGANARAAATSARLVLAAESARPGDTIMAGVHLEMGFGWHIYWRNPGESGIATKINWTLPAGVTAGEIQWPVPEKYVAEGLTTFVHHGETVLLVPLTIGPQVASGPLEIKAKVTWLECEKQCVPGRAEVGASLTIGTETKPGKEAALIDAWLKKLPPQIDPATVLAWWEKDGAGAVRPLILEWSAPPSAKDPDFFAFGTDPKTKPAVEILPAEGGKVRIRKLVEKPEGEWPAQVAGFLVFKSGAGELTAFETKVPVTGAPAGRAASSISPAPSVAASAPAPVVAVSVPSLPGMLGLAFLGGLILNIMPCVLPVIALKIFGFVQQSKEEPAKVKRLGLIYGLGVLCSFLALAGLVIAVQKAGRSASWGMQFQNAQFLVAMTTLVTLVALNLFGLFEIMLGGRAMGAAGELASKEGAAGAFFNGVLATALATPCTAPFLAAALGFAFGQPPATIAVVFLTVGLGLAAPYVILSLQPAWLKFLPKPGAWMEKFKIAMGFPMLGTAIWLFSLAAAHFGNRGALWLGIFLVLVAFAAWIFGEFFQRGTKRRGLALAICLLLIGAAYGYALEHELRWRAPATPAAASGILKESADGIEWQAWSPEAVAKARAEGKPVLVDFTADWCLTCQVNKKTSLEIPSVRAKLKEVKAVALLGDHTREDDRITKELQVHKRAGVPLVLVYPADGKSGPIVLPEVLTPNIVLDALEKAK